MLATRRLGGSRRSRTAVLGTTLLMVLTLAGGALGGVARADDDVPTQQEVADAKAAAEGKARDVAAVEADLAVANDELRRTAVAAAQAAEAYNGARYALAQARRQVRLAERHATAAAADVERQRTAYADILTAGYQLSPELSALSAIVDADGFSEVLDETYAIDNAQDAIDAQYDAYQAAAVLADVATDQAETARQQAADAEHEARAARDRARDAQTSAAAAAQSIAARKSALVSELARLQGISVSLAEQRQEAMEQAAAEAAAAAAQQEAEQQAQDDPPAADPPAGDPPADDPEPTPDPTPDPTPPPAPSGASAAIAFARAQLGEPYRWGAAGPDAWDCSGLTMGAWRAGGRSLPHYSVAQYQQSTPISASQLQPGDLVFWGSSSSSSSIYHVALYVGDGQIIHAPRTGRPVSQESMYYWIPPNFYARP